VGQTAALIVQGIESATNSRVENVTTILDELTATRHALDSARDGDVVVVCVDHANQIWKELQRRQHGAASESDGLRAVVGVIDADDEIDIEA
jgi:cyanophycin synthetase